MRCDVMLKVGPISGDKSDRQRDRKKKEEKARSHGSRMR